MAGITFSGLATGLDTDALVKGLVQAERAPITRLQKQQQTLAARSTKLGTLRARLEDLRTAARALDSRAEASPTKVTSSAESIVAARSSGGAAPGRFDLRVERLATSTRVYSDGFAARDATGLFGTGTLEIQAGSKPPVTISVDASDTLDTVASKLTAAGTDWTVGVLYDGGAYRLQVNGNSTGAANALTITETGVTLGLSAPGNVRQAAQDAQISLDGFTLTSPTNTVTSAIPGVTLELVSESPVGTTQSLRIERDGETLRTRVQALVDAYNAVQSFVTTESTYSGVTKGPESLVGDSALRSVQSRLRGATANPVAGVSGRYTTLASLGVKSRNDGSWSLDATELAKAVSTDPEAVAAVLGGDGGVAKTLQSVIGELADAGTGLIPKRIASNDGLRRRLSDQVDRLERRVDQYETRMRAQFTALERLVSTMQSQGNQLQSILKSNSAQSG